jgi:peroxiredoxin
MIVNNVANKCTVPVDTVKIHVLLMDYLLVLFNKAYYFLNFYRCANTPLCEQHKSSFNTRIEVKGKGVP